MKIIHLVQRYYPAISGAEYYIKRISEIINKKYKVMVLCSNALDFIAFKSKNGKVIKPGYTKINGVSIYRYPVKYSYFFNKDSILDHFNIRKVIRFLAKNRLYLFDFYDMILNGPHCPELIKQLFNIDVDIIHSSCFPYSINIYALFKKYLDKIPVICTPFYHYANPRYQNKGYIRILSRFNKILTCTNLESRYIIQMSDNRKIKDKIIRIKMGVDFKIFKKANPTKLRNDFNINEKPLVLFCGYKNYEKGAIHLLRSLKYTIKEIPDIMYMFIGPGTKAFNLEKKRLSKNLREHIINIGIVPYDNIKIKASAFMASDIYVMPSRTDAYGISFLEAWACKKPVIGANIGATPEVIKHNYNGLLVPFGSPKKIAENIIKLIKNPRLSEELGNNGYNKIKNQSWKNIAKRIQEIYLSVINEN